MKRGRNPERKTRSPKGKSHKPQKISFDKDSLTVQAKKQHAECVALRFVEDRKEIGAAEKSERGDIIQRIKKSNRGRDQNKGNHQPGPRSYSRC